MRAEARGRRYALVTGGSSGIGLATAHGLLPHFDTVGIVGRNQARLEQAAEDLRSSGTGAVETFQADFSSLPDVRRLASEVRECFPSLCVLVNNAGVWHRERRVSKDGYEDTFAVNHLAHFLLTNELENLLRLGAPSRVVNVSSWTHARTKSINWGDLMFEKGFKGFRAYAHSKLANVLYSNELARRWTSQGIASNALNPGNVRSRITRNNTFLNALHQSPIARLLIMTEADGARASVRAALSPELEGVSGRYFDKLEERLPSEAARDLEAARRLWEVSEQLVADALA